MDEITFTPERQLRAFNVQTVRRSPLETKSEAATLLIIGVAIGLIVFNFWVNGSASAPVPFNDQTPTHADATSHQPRPLTTLAPHEVGALEWADNPDTLFRTHLRYGGTLVYRGRSLALLGVKAKDGLWKMVKVGLLESVPDTHFTLERLDPHAAFVKDPAGVIHRLFIPHEWENLKAYYQFRDHPTSETLRTLSQTAMWLPATGLRRMFDCMLIPTSGKDDPADFAKLVPLLEDFACQLAIDVRTRDLKVKASRELAAFLKAHGIYSYQVMDVAPPTLE